MPNAPRSAAERKADTLAMLSTPAIDVWVASASEGYSSPHPHLVPLSLGWIDERVVIAVEASSVTARNITTHRRARLAIGPTRDVVLIDSVLHLSWSMADVPSSVADGYATQAAWDPRGSGDGFVYLALRPERIQAWHEANEIAGRTLMRAGRWLV